MTVSLNGTTGVTFPDASVQNTAATGFGFKNRIINGAMMIDQRNAGASGTASSVSANTVDRWGYYGSQASKGTWQQNAGAVTPPVGFTNYLGFTSSSSYSVLTGDIFEFLQKVEGLNVSDLGFGTANAATVTLSFWVRSSLTGTFGGGLSNSTYTRNYPFTYTISAANTWEQKTISISGDTTGTWLTTNGIGMTVIFGLGVGSSLSAAANTWNGTTNAVLPTGATSVVGTNGATFYITGVQLEKGSTATSFDYRPYGTELALCQRYFETSYRSGDAVGTANLLGQAASPVGSNTVPVGQAYSQICFNVAKRTTPTIVLYGYQGGSGKVSNWSTGADFAANSGMVNTASTQGFNAYNGAGATLSTSNYGVIYHWTASTEL